MMNTAAIIETHLTIPDILSSTTRKRLDKISMIDVTPLSQQKTYCVLDGLA